MAGDHLFFDRAKNQEYNVTIVSCDPWVIRNKKGDLGCRRIHSTILKRIRRNG